MQAIISPVVAANLKKTTNEQWKQLHVSDHVSFEDFSVDSSHYAMAPKCIYTINGQPLISKHIRKQQRRAKLQVQIQLQQKQNADMRTFNQTTNLIHRSSLMEGTIYDGKEFQTDIKFPEEQFQSSLLVENHPKKEKSPAYKIAPQEYQRSPRSAELFQNPGVLHKPAVKSIPMYFDTRAKRINQKILHMIERMAEIEHGQQELHQYQHSMHEDTTELPNEEEEGYQEEVNQHDQHQQIEPFSMDDGNQTPDVMQKTMISEERTSTMKHHSAMKRSIPESLASVSEVSKQAKGKNIVKCDGGTQTGITPSKHSNNISYAEVNMASVKERGVFSSGNNDIPSISGGNMNQTMFSGGSLITANKVYQKTHRFSNLVIENSKRNGELGILPMTLTSFTTQNASSQRGGILKFERIQKGKVQLGQPLSPTPQIALPKILNQGISQIKQPQSPAISINKSGLDRISDYKNQAVPRNSEKKIENIRLEILMNNKDMPSLESIRSKKQILQSKHKDFTHKLTSLSPSNNASMLSPLSTIAYEGNLAFSNSYFPIQHSFVEQQNKRNEQQHQKHGITAPLLAMLPNCDGKQSFNPHDVSVNNTVEKITSNEDISPITPPNMDFTTNAALSTKGFNSTRNHNQGNETLVKNSADSRRNTFVMRDFSTTLREAHITGEVQIKIKKQHQTIDETRNTKTLRKPQMQHSQILQQEINAIAEDQKRIWNIKKPRPSIEAKDEVGALITTTSYALADQLSRTISERKQLVRDLRKKEYTNQNAISQNLTQSKIGNNERKSPRGVALILEPKVINFGSGCSQQVVNKQSPSNNAKCQQEMQSSFKRSPNQSPLKTSLQKNHSHHIQPNILSQFILSLQAQQQASIPTILGHALANKPHQTDSQKKFKVSNNINNSDVKHESSYRVTSYQPTIPQSMENGTQTMDEMPLDCDRKVSDAQGDSKVTSEADLQNVSNAVGSLSPTYHPLIMVNTVSTGIGGPNTEEPQHLSESPKILHVSGQGKVRSPGLPTHYRLNNKSKVFTLALMNEPSGSYNEWREEDEIGFRAPGNNKQGKKNAKSLLTQQKKASIQELIIAENQFFARNSNEQ